MYFIAFGDWGENSELKQRIKTLIEVKKPNAILSLGDNFYDYGISSTNDPMWETHYKCYFATFFFAILGNHDHLGNIQAQIDYSKLNSSWIMPHRFYNRSYKEVNLIALDTYELAPYESMMNAAAMKFNPNQVRQFIKQLQQERQLEWLEHVLKTNTSKWIIVFGHYPIYSNGGHGNTPELHKHLLPLLKKYKVHLYLSGHDHNISYYKDEVHCLVSGCGSRQGTISNQPGFTKLPSLGLAYVKTSMEELEFGFYDMVGTTIMKEILR